MPRTNATSRKKEIMRNVSLKMPGSLYDQAAVLGDHVRGGTSEVLRRAITAGLPLVRVQSRVTISKG